ncbi:3-oxoacyl-ACP reductase FabG [Lipingzhangella sp. LS1_29]|uniref:3-oxoacyl-ACP reductase FabG n=1 Tax=Lipingzhangella rawalii TaxID=2055835 RepID=A0ABU2HAE1_9ACTN|nr:3-oxoacyl-ACP reductase FabG [Lipingzhangella rawalii]MDS1271982.1 3-oxoacyl-ACP reductase FabG [Lipingzhangella rawalii]
MSQTSRVAIVTGAARGIGAETARRLAANGNAVAAVDRADATETAEAITAAGGSALALECDVSDEDQVRSTVQKITEQLGAPTILVNNAGIIRDNLLFKMTVDDWDAVMNVHLRGAFLMSRETQSHMREAGWGRIINLSSTSAQGNRGQANYSTAKAGLQGLTKTLAIELGKYGITANAVAPGTTETDMLKATAERIGVDFQDFTSAAAGQIPAGRTGKPDDIAATIAFLAGEDAGFVNGQVIYVAGGPKD